MSIEIYSKAEVIKKDDTYYYLLKHHSKNDCICRGQVVIGADFRNKYLKRDGRGGSWSIKAHGNESAYNEKRIALTSWNAPTSYYYGQVQFGNKKNIALYWAKHKAKNFYTDFDDAQKYNINELIEQYKHKDNAYTIDLSSIGAEKEYKAVYEYCGKVYTMQGNAVEYNGKHYWNLDNL